MRNLNHPSILTDSTEVMNNLAELYPQMERQRAAMDMIDRVLKKDPYFVMAMLSKVDLLKEVRLMNRK